MSGNEIISLLEMIVGNHQIINQIGAEASDKQISNKIEFIKEHFNYSDRLNIFFNSEFADVMYLLAIADMMAVDDILLTEDKFIDTKLAHKYIEDLILRGFQNRDEVEIGQQRFLSLLPDSIREKDIDIFYGIFDEFKIDPNQFFHFMYNIYGISYGMFVTKVLNDEKEIILVLDLCRKIIEKNNGLVEEITIKFSPSLNIEMLKKILDNESIENVINNKTDFLYSPNCQIK